MSKNSCMVCETHALDIVNINNYGPVCTSCIENTDLFITCDDCGELAEVPSMKAVESDWLICKSCIIK